MKHFLITLSFFISAFGFAQNTGSISGNVLDLESDNAPLMYAEVLIKETGTKVLSNEFGVFQFNNLETGTYTLICSFVGYDTKETQTKVLSNSSTNLTLQLAASTISLDELVFAIASNEEKATATSNK